MIKGWKNLTKKQVNHLKEMKCNDTLVFAQVRKKQNARRAECDRLKIPPPCRDCDEIAKALGVEQLSEEVRKEALCEERDQGMPVLSEYKCD